MSLANILQPNDYTLYCSSINIANGDPIAAYYYDALTLNVTYEDGITDTWACQLERIGNTVFLTIPYKNHTLGTILTPNRYIDGGQIPTEYRPSTGSTSGGTDVQYGPAYRVSTSSGRDFGVFDVKSNGAIDFYTNKDLAAPVAGQGIGFFKQVCQWFI